MPTRHLLGAALALTLSLGTLTGCSDGGETFREATHSVDPAATDPADPTPPSAAPHATPSITPTVAAWDTLTGDFDRLLGALRNDQSLTPDTPDAAAQRYGDVLSDGVRIADIDPGGKHGEDGLRFCLTGAEGTYFTFAALEGPDGMVLRRTYGTGACDYGTGDIVGEADLGPMRRRGVIESLRSDTMDVAVAVETWATDHPGRLPATTGPLFKDYGLTLSEGNAITRYTVAADGTYRVCVRHNSGAWGTLSTTADTTRNMSWPVQAVGVKGRCVYEEMSDEAFDDLLAAMAPTEVFTRGADLAEQVPTLAATPLQDVFHLH